MGPRSTPDGQIAVREEGGKEEKSANGEAGKRAVLAIEPSEHAGGYHAEEVWGRQSCGAG